MREHVSRDKKTTTGFSIPSLKHPVRGFGLDSSEATPPAVPLVQPLNKPPGHHISRISVRPQTKLTVNQPGDIFEQEADSVAQKVMRRLNNNSVNSQSIQRQAAPQEDEELQMKPLSSSITSLQRQEAPEEEELQMKSVDNSTLQRQAAPEEEEELQMKSLSNSTLQRQAAPEEEEELQMKSVDNSTLQRQQAPEEEEEVQMKSLSNSTLQRQASGGGMAASSNLETSIQQARGGGQPLSDEIKQPMEQAFGADFGGVKIHTDSQSDQLNQSIQARAFTTGSDIFFRQGEYNPGSHSGKELLAHELTHVVQQNGGAVQRKILPNLETKENKIQTKVANSGNSPASESQENPQKKNLDDSQGQSQQVDSQGKTEAAESKSQATSKKGGVTDTPPANGNGTTPNAPPANQGGKPTGNPSDAQNQDNPQSAAQGDQQGKPEQLRGQQANAGVTADLAGAGAGGEVGELPGANAGIPGGEPGTEVAVDDGEKAPASAEDDPAFQAVVNNTKQVAGKQKEHAPATNKAEAAQGAAEPPGNEVDSKAQANQVGEMEQAPTPGFDAAGFKAKLMERIADMAPKNLQEADEFKNNNKLDSVKGELSGKVKEEQKASQGQLEEKTKEQPDTSGIEAKQVTPLPQTEPGTPPAGVNAEQAAPKSKGQGEVEAPLQAESQKLDQQMQEADITEEQLAKSNEPEFQGALAAKKDAQTHAVEAPPQYRQQEQGILANAQATAEATAQQHLQAMHGIRTQNLNQVAEQQVGTKGKDEQARAKVAGDINKIYEATKAKVEKTLSELDGQVIQAFDAGAADAKKAFEDYVGKRMDKYKSDRYSGFWGPAKWVGDKLFGMPSEVNAFYQEGRDLYIQQMDGVINKVVAIISKGLTQAKAEIASGKQEIQNYVNKLPQDLKGVGQQAAADIDSKFDELQQSVDNKQDELIDTLAQKYKENLDAVDARIEEMKAENKGLIQKAFDFVVGVIKTIIELTKMLLQVLARVASVVGQILKDPIGFLNNLIQAVKQGFLNFMKNIGKHLQQGLIGWLTGTMAEAGIEMPENFDLKGIFSLAMQLLGFTYEAIRAQAVKRLGEEKVSRMEQTVEVFKILATEGVAGMWQFVQEKIGDLNALIIEPIKNFIIEKVITAGIEWILSLLTPASAFIKAAKAIYEIVKFFIERAQQIADLINAILDAIGAIAAGSLDQAIKGVENALAKSLPVVISFLASLLGLGGIAGKIQAIFQKLRKPMEKAVNWVIDKGSKAFKAVGNKFNNSKVGKKFNAAKDKATEKYKAGKQWVEDKKAAGEQWVEDKKAGAEQWVNDKKEGVSNKFKNSKVGKKVGALTESAKEKYKAGKQWVKDNKEAVKDKYTKTVNKGKEKLVALVEWWKAKKKFTAKDGEAHTLFFEGTDKNATLMIASKRKTYEAFIDDIDVNHQPEPIKKAKTEAKTIAEKIDTIGKKRKGKGKGVQTAEGQDIKQEIVNELNKLAVPTSILAATSTSQPPSVVEYGDLTSEGGATFMNAKILSQNNVAGYPPKDKPAIWEKANRRKGVYIQGHLLNDNLGGPGRAFNLAPITDYTNKQHLKFVEKDVKKAVLDQNKVVRFKVDVVYSKHPERSSQKAIEDRIKNGQSTDINQDKNKLEIMKYEQENLPRAFANEWAILKHDGSKWVDDNVKDTLYILNSLPDSEPSI